MNFTHSILQLDDDTTADPISTDVLARKGGQDC